MNLIYAKALNQKLQKHAEKSIQKAVQSYTVEFISKCPNCEKFQTCGKRLLIKNIPD